MIPITIHSIAEPAPGPAWQGLFHRFWPAYRAWFTRDKRAKRPNLALCRAALGRHMPELVPTYERLSHLARQAAAGVGNPARDDAAARMLTLWRPPAFMTGCSQAVWTRGPGPGPLIRNYEYSPDLFEGVLIRTAYTRPVLGMSDCLWGLLDGVNDAGLCAALAFGGRDAIGEGFGIPLVLRYVLETCTDTRSACATLARVPVHMAYNVTMVDAAGDYATVQVGPDRPAIVAREQVSTNHQNAMAEAREDSPQRRRERRGMGAAAGSKAQTSAAVAGLATGVAAPLPIPTPAAHQSAFTTKYARITATHERACALRALLDDPAATAATLADRFLEQPIYSRAWDRGWGTLYTAAYNPSTRSIELRWPGEPRLTQSISALTPGAATITLAPSARP